MGHHNHHFSGDPFASAGFWGPPTSAANFCEEDYAVTLYIAEFVNCLTNLAYIYYSAKYAFKRGRNLRWNGHDFMSASLFLVGAASLVYHATLRQATQLLDDLSMLLLGTSFLLSVYTANQTPGVRYLLASIILSSISAVSITYLRSGNILLHTYSFITVLMLTWPRTLYLIQCKPSSITDRPGPQKAQAGVEKNQLDLKVDPPRFEKKQSDPEKDGSKVDMDRSALTYRLARAGVLLGVAFILWNIDLEMCSDLRALRSHVGLPWNWLLELHGWWHFLTAAAAFEFMKLARDICDEGG